MTINHYFQNYSAVNEQRLMESLITESIQIMGFNAFYLPNSNEEARDLLYGEDPLKTFVSQFQVEMYLSSALEYGGDREFFSKFGLEIRNTASVIVSKKAFEERVTNIESNILRPREGDLVYVPFLNGTGELFEIKFVNQTKDFFSLGRKIPYYYELELEKFKYSNELVSTGVPGIDKVMTDDAYTLDLNMDLSTGAGNYLVGEIVWQSPDDTYANLNATGTVSGWYPNTNADLISTTLNENTTTFMTSNSLQLISVAGEFTYDTPVFGSYSSAFYDILAYDPLEDATVSNPSDNQYIEHSANGIVVKTETNQFGTI